MRRLNARSRAAFQPPASTPAEAMDSPAFQFRTVPHTPFSLISRIRGKPLRTGGFCVSLLAALAAALFLLLFLRSESRSGGRHFGIVIDGGSTGTRIHVFVYGAGRDGSLVMDLGSSATMRVNPGLSAYAEEADRAGESLVELLEFARRRVPRRRWAETTVRLMATAGMRLLEKKTQERILVSCSKVLEASGFLFKLDWASVISGTDEGIYAWVAANYALGTLGGDPQHTTGIIELGGASAQVTFVSNEPFPSEFAHVLQFGKSTYHLYSHSFLQFGQNVAHDSLDEMLSSGELRSDPCSPNRFLEQVPPVKTLIGDLTSNRISSAHAGGNFSECRFAAVSLLQRRKDKCPYKACHLGTFVPSLQGKFLATENFFFTSKFLGLGSSARLSDFIAAGEKLCGGDWTSLQRKYQFLKEEDLRHYCFSTAYIVALLHDSLGVPLDDRRIIFANKVSNVPLEWALGAFIMQKMADPSAEQGDWLSGIVSGDSSAWPSLLVVCSFLVIVAWTLSRWRKPQLKTIYDLEKGRYIVTRVTL